MWGWDGWGGGLSGFWHVIVGIFFGIGQLFALLVFLGVLFLFVRFLLVGTKAAQLYIARHAPTPPATPTAPAASAPTTTAPAKPATKPAAATKPTTTTTRRTPPKPPTN